MAGKPAGRPIGKRHQDDVRAKIQASAIINRFYKAFEGEIELTSVQVNIGKVLLDKALPDLKAIEHSGDPDNPLNVIQKVESYIVDPKNSNT
jgi:hypothetical protein